MSQKSRIIWEYHLSFELNVKGERTHIINQQGYNITEAIAEVRKAYPLAHLFIEHSKHKALQPIGK